MRLRLAARRSVVFPEKLFDFLHLLPLQQRENIELAYAYKMRQVAFDGAARQAALRAISSMVLPA